MVCTLPPLADNVPAAWRKKTMYDTYKTLINNYLNRYFKNCLKMLFNDFTYSLDLFNFFVIPKPYKIASDYSMPKVGQSHQAPTDK